MTNRILFYMRQADDALELVMSSSHPPKPDSIEHRAVVLMHRLYPTAKVVPGRLNKSKAARQAVIRQIKREDTTDTFPTEEWNNLRQGLRRMTTALLRVHDKAIAEEQNRETRRRALPVATS